MARGRSSFVAAAVLAAIAALASCLDRPDLEELLLEPVIATKRDTSASFASFATFAVTDVIPVLPSLDAGPSSTTVDPAIAAPTLEEIAAQLSARGYARVARTAAPDLGVAVSAVNQLRTVNVAYGAWWGNGAAAPGYWGYPTGLGFAAPIGYATVAWQSGTLIIELYDLRAAREAARRSGVEAGAPSPEVSASIRVVWAALIHGVVGAEGASLAAPPIEEIRQAFSQSPYLVRPAAPSEAP